MEPRAVGHGFGRAKPPSGPASPAFSRLSRPAWINFALSYYGVDKNPTAVDLAKVSLWLITLAKEHPFTFVDHALRHGDSLVGLSRRQIECFHWLGDAPVFQDDFSTKGIREQVEQAHALRTQIRTADEQTSDAALYALWGETQDALTHVRLYGDLVVAAFFAGSKPKERERKRLDYAREVKDGSAVHHRVPLEAWRHAELPLVPFHWEIEFPEVFQRANSGFDAVVGNPPFLGGKKISTVLGEEYRDWLVAFHEESNRNADLVAHFFRRTFTLIRREGTFGFIATNTVAQGDTRATGLRWICANGGAIYHARKRVKWPGMAAVIVSVLHIIKGTYNQTKQLDGQTVEMISAFLFHRGSSENPQVIQQNASKSFVGSYVLGMGFTFDDNDTKGVATSIAEMQRLIKTNPVNQAVIFPYLGGEEINTSPSHTYHRYVINFGDRSEAECWQRWPELMAIVEAKVKPERVAQNMESSRRYWWQFGGKRPGLDAAIAPLNRVLVIAAISGTFALTFLPRGIVYSHKLIIFPFQTHAAFCALQARPHEIWTRFFSSSMKDDLNYSPSDCFLNFPFPANWASDPALEAVGKVYYDYRAALMERNNAGLTKTYNRFHDPYEHDAEIAQLRELHAAMDRAVLAAYGWTDIPTDCAFLLDYEIDEAEWGSKKKPYRYRWPDDVRDEVLARLLELNAQRAREEQLAGVAKAKGGKKPGRAGGMEDMFE